MKTSLFSLPIFLLISFILYPSSLFCSASQYMLPAVVDASGKLVRTDLQYYIKPANNSGKDRGGGLGLRGIHGNGSSSSCPLCVVQEIIELRDGLSLTFSPVVTPQDGIIRVFTDLNIQFNFPDTCNQPTVWRLQKSKGKKFVNLGGVIGNPGPKTLNNWFKIERIANELKYKFVYCPSVCSSCKVICKDIGIILQNEKRRLALRDEPYEIIFDQ